MNISALNMTVRIVSSQAHTPSTVAASIRALAASLSNACTITQQSTCNLLVIFPQWECTEMGILVAQRLAEGRHMLAVLADEVEVPAWLASIEHPNFMFCHYAKIEQDIPDIVRRRLGVLHDLAHDGDLLPFASAVHEELAA